MPVSGATASMADTPPANRHPVSLLPKELPPLGGGTVCGDTPGERARAQCLASNAAF